MTGIVRTPWFPVMVPPPSPEFVFWDLDGPILDVAERHHRVYADFSAAHGGHPLSREKYWERKRQREDTEAILRASGLPHHAPQFRAWWFSQIESPNYLQLDRVWPGVDSLLADLLVSRSLVLVTLRHSAEALRWQLRRCAIEARFAEVLSAPDATDRSADRAAIKVRLVQERFGSASLRGWFVGDTETDVRAGRTLGLRTAAVGFGIRTSDCLRAAQPDVLCEHPEELLQWARGLIAAGP